MDDSAVKESEDKQIPESLDPVEGEKEQKQQQYQDHATGDEDDAVSNLADDDEEDGSHASGTTGENDEENDNMEDEEHDFDDDKSKSTLNDATSKASSTATPLKKEDVSSPSSLATGDAKASTPSSVASFSDGPPKKKKRFVPTVPSESRRGRTPAVAGLTIPFRTVKKAMKMDPANSIVQSEAAVVTTKAAELFLQRLALNSQAMCEAKKRNTIRYEDIADARANDPSMAFLSSIIP